MMERADQDSRRRQALIHGAPIAMVALAALAAHGALATAHPLPALILLLWIVADSLTLGLLARTGGRPPIQAVLATLAGSCVLTWAASPALLRRVLLQTPALAAMMALVVLLHAGWAMVRAGRLLTQDQPASGRWMAAAAQFLPPALLRLVAAEYAVLHIALFRWRSPPDVPPHARAFAYHRHLAPICATLLALSAIEVAVYHLLLAHWSRAAMVGMFVLSDVGFVYLIGVIKSFRLRPVLLMPEGLRIRAGLLLDQFVPIEAIAAVETDFCAETLRDPATLNAALLAWPNVVLRLDTPLQRTTLLGRRRSFTRIAFRLDEPAPFLRLLDWRLGHRTR